MARSQVKICELVAQHLANQMANGVGDVPAWPAGPLFLFLGHEVAEVGNAGGNGKPDAVHEGGDRGQGPTDDGVEGEDYGAESHEEGANGLAQGVCPG